MQFWDGKTNLHVKQSLGKILATWFWDYQILGTQNHF